VRAREQRDPARHEPNEEVARRHRIARGALAFAAGAVGEHSVLELVSTGPAASFDGASEDGTRVSFQTADTLLSADTDSSVDVYQRAGGETTLLFARPGRQRRAARARRR
jgi:hypothetical protein